MGIVWGTAIAENAAVLSLALESISTTYLCNTERCQHKYKWCKRYSCFSVKIWIQSSSHFCQYFVSLRCIYMGIVWGIVVTANTAMVIVLSLVPELISTTYLCNAQRCQHKYKWCKRCCSVPPTFLLKFYCMFKATAFALNVMFWSFFVWCSCH